MASKKRVGCIYRVSIKSQLEDDEIPMQRNACLAFIDKQDGWVLEKEYYGKGISGYHTKLAERDDIQEARKDAEDGKINVLLCFMFDRVGRREDESPFVLKWFSEQGVETWSVMEGEQKFEQHTDLLVNYLRFWQAEGESKKTSIRVNEDHEQMVKQGLFRGGVPPYGYHLEKSGVFNDDGKELSKQVIDPEESEVVKLIYECVYKKGWGSNRIAGHLNSPEVSIKSRTGVGWGTGVINYILTNPIYKGYVTYGKTRRVRGSYIRQPKSEWIMSKDQISELVIIEENAWDEVQEIRNKRSRKFTKREGVTHELASETPLLFVGIIRCGHCGSTLTTTYNTKKYTLVDGTEVSRRYAKYRCSGKALKRTECDGQTIYGQKVLEETIVGEIKKILKKFEKVDATDLINERKNSKRNEHSDNISRIEKEIENIKKELVVLNAEISKSLLGDSSFTPEMLSAVIKEKNVTLNTLDEELVELRINVRDTNEEGKKIEKYIRLIPVWEDEFDHLSIDEKKVLVREMIKGITVSSGKIKIEMYNSELFK